MGRPCQQSICGIHRNELTLRYIFIDADGSSSGPNSYTGLIGKAISEDSTKYPLLQFQSIPGKIKNIPSEVIKELITDYQYLYEISLAIQIGPDVVDKKSLSRNPGKLRQARWNTLANRILRLYISSSHPSHELRRLVYFILNQYVPVWIQFKLFWKISNGSINFFYLVQLSKDLPPQDKLIVYKVLQTNGFWSHPENILVSMVSDMSRLVHERPVNIILKSRLSSNVDCLISEPRKFKVPKFKFDADNYHNLVDLDTIITTEPPLTMLLTYEELRSVIDKPFIFPSFPCHSQAVERW